MNKTDGSKSTSITELHQHTLFEKDFGASKTRYVVRLIQFEDSKSQYVALSRQWFKADTSQWFPTKTGHIFLPIPAWQALARVASQLNQDFARFTDDGSCRGGRDTERASSATTGVANGASGTTPGSSDGTNCTPEPNKQKQSRKAHASRFPDDDGNVGRHKRSKQTQ
jgi:hypothetical protein